MKSAKPYFSILAALALLASYPSVQADNTWSLVVSPANYRATKTVNLDPNYQQVSFFMDQDNVRVKVQITDENTGTIERGNYWVINGQHGKEETEGQYDEAEFVIEKAWYDNPTNLLWEFQSSMPAMFQNADTESNPEIRNAMIEARDEMVQGFVTELQDRYIEQAQQACADKQCRVFRHEFTAEQASRPGHIDFYVDPDSGYILKRIDYAPEHRWEDGEIAPEIIENTIIEFNLNLTIENS